MSRAPVVPLALVSGLALLWGSGPLLTGSAQAAGRTPAPSASRPVRVPAAVEDLAMLAGGTLRVVTDAREVAVREVGRTGKLAPPTTLPGPSPYDEDAGRTTIVTQAGALSAYRVPGPPSRIEVLESDAAGKVGAPEAIPGTELGTGPFVTAGGGAVALVFAVQLAPGSIEFRLAFRPAGAARFGAAVPIDAPTPGDLASPLPVSDAYVVRLGDDGSGAILVGPNEFGLTKTPTATRLRRIAADGTLGPWIPVGSGRANSGVADLAVGPDGTIAIARSTQTSVGTGKQRRTRSAIEASSLPVGAGAVTPIQRLAPGDDSGSAESNLAVAIGPDRQAVVADTGEHPDRVDVFTGRAGALRRSASFRAFQPDSVLATVTRDGGVTVSWTPGTKVNTGAPVMAARKAPGRRFSRAAIVARVPHREAGVYGRQLVPTGAGRAVLRFSEEHEDDFTDYLTMLR